MFVRGTRKNAASSLPINYHSRETMHRQISSCLVVTVPVAYDAGTQSYCYLQAGLVLSVFVIWCKEEKERERQENVTLCSLCHLRCVHEDCECAFTVTDWKRCNQTVQHNGMHPFHFCLWRTVKDRVLVQRNERATASVTSSQVSPIRITGKCVCMCLW